MKNFISDKKVFYAGLVYLISIVVFILLRILWGAGFLSGLDSVLNDFVFAIIMQLLVLTALPLGLWMLLCKQNFKQVKERFFIKKISFKTVLYSLLIGILTYVLIIFVSTFWSFLLHPFIVLMYMYVINVDLASLTSIQLGEQALRGNDVDYCSLKMQSIEIQNQTEYNRSS